MCPKLNYIGAYARELIASCWPTAVLVSERPLTERRSDFCPKVHSRRDPLCFVGPGLPASFSGGHYMTLENRIV